MNVTEKSLVKNAQKWVDGGEQVLAAGVFKPVGGNTAVLGGAAAGQVAGYVTGATGVADSALGVAGVAGGLLARHELATQQGIPTQTLVAVTPRRLYAFRAGTDDLVGSKVKERFAVWERDRVAISVHAHLLTRVLEIHDLDTDKTYQFEADKGSWNHGTVVVKLLLQDQAAVAQYKGAPA